MHTPVPDQPESKPSALSALAPVVYDPLRYGRAYSWLVLFSTLDVLMTGIILTGLLSVHGVNGFEANPIARSVINQWGMLGASLFKFALVFLAITLCEYIGHLREPVGRRLSWLMVSIGVIPFLWSMLLLYSAMVIPALRAL